MRKPADPRRPHAFLVETERAESGEIVSVATIFLSNRECPWRCLMCDLWKNTLTETVPVGAIPAQIDYALAELSQQRGAGFQPAASVGIPAASSSHEEGYPPDSQKGMPTRHVRFESGSPSPPGEGKSFGSQFSCIPARPRAARPAPRQIKLYNSGSFFDPRAIPSEEYVGIAGRVGTFERVIVECHPALVGESALEFRDLLNATDTSQAYPLVHRPTPGPSREGNSAAAPPATLPSIGGVGGGFVIAPDALNITAHGAGAGPELEVAMGLETAHPQVLEKLNKRMTLDQFRRAAEILRANHIALRTFVLVKPPFLDEAEALHWAKRSVDFALDCGATAVSLIPARLGNGALERLAERGEFSPPKLATLEAALEYGIGLKRARVFADLWDLEQFSDCKECLEGRRARLHEMNLRQITQPRVACDWCRERTR